ncbi:hypothetical protein FHS29_003552 [Saccharothrix tamanrassetensis]|uniref:Uncharacterized protein n=1 Tax=Saccharothrix tamanrassetensis TaxID=1051531 RepID=A0A841CI29_9PSEU|nr:hypothetical protein [Saccharothrix tamanrassetensis]MBB5956959.1 hypothetical protein [Saccharothrix tamanrassetensis]
MRSASVARVTANDGRNFVASRSAPSNSSDIVAAKGNPVRSVLDFLGTPLVALLATLISVVGLVLVLVAGPVV